MVEMTSVEIAGITILEPVTTITDLLVSAVCFYAWKKLSKHSDSLHLHIRLYRYFFFVMGMATLFGGIIGHGFLYLFSFAWKLPGWLVSMLAVGLAERGAIMHARPLIKPQVGKFFAIFNIVELLVIMFFAMYTLIFRFVEIHAMYGLLLVVFSFECYTYVKTKDEGSRIALWAVFFAAIAAACHIGKFTIHTWFNYLDLSHIFMAVSAFVLYKGVMKMKTHS